jgi:hypothetical protein
VDGFSTDFLTFYYPLKLAKSPYPKQKKPGGIASSRLTHESICAQSIYSHRNAGYLSATLRGTTTDSYRYFSQVV